MKTYEVIREIYNECAGKFEVDSKFPDEVSTDDIIATLTSWFYGKLPEYTVETDKNGTLIYTMTTPIVERYSFSEF